MSDSDTQSSGAAGASGSPDGGWLARLREAFGFKTTASLRRNLEEVLDQEDALDAAFSPEERKLIRNILDLRETRVDDVMVQRADILAVEVDITLAELINAFENSGHSRMPVYRETLDDPVGMVHIKDLMTHLTLEARSGRGDPDAPLDFSTVDLSRQLSDVQLIRKVLYVPPSMPAAVLLSKMQANRIQMALVIDEYGGTDGIVSIEDIVETIVGEIEDEHDEENGPQIRAVSPGIFIADARADLEQVHEVLGEAFVIDDDYDEDVDTLGGLLASMLGRIPARGEIVTPDALPGWEIEVLDADTHRLKSVRMVQIRTEGS
jgi:CBS domain containing-hemolysin-like protein